MSDATQRYGIDQNIGLGYARLDQQGQQWQDQFGLQRDRFGLEQDRFGFQQDQADFGNLLQLGNMAFGLGNFSNQALANEYNMGQTILAQAPGMMNQQVNVGGAYNTAQNGAMGAANLQQQQNNSMFQGIGQLAMGAAMLSGEAYKTVYGEMPQAAKDKVSAMMLAMPIYDWDYLPEYREKGDAVRFGPLAEDFNANITEAEGDTIDVQRYIGALHVTMQQLYAEIRRLESMLFHAVNQSGIVHRDETFNTSEESLPDQFESIMQEAAQRWKEVQHVG